MHWLIFCVLLHLLAHAEALDACNAGYTGGNFIGPYSDTACDRFIALIIQKPSFASVSTRNKTAIGSSTLPTYNPLGGPNGNGHVRFDRSLSQFLNAEPRAWNTETNGGLTVIALIRFSKFNDGYPDQFIFQATIPYLHYERGLFYLKTDWQDTSTLTCVLENYGAAIATVTTEAGVVKDSWTLVVIKYDWVSALVSMSTDMTPPLTQSVDQYPGHFPDCQLRSFLLIFITILISI